MASGNLSESFHQFYQQCILLVSGWEPFKGQVFPEKKSCLFLFEPLTPSKINLRFFDEMFVELLVKTAFYVSKGDIRGKIFSFCCCSDKLGFEQKTFGLQD